MAPRQSVGIDQVPRVVDLVAAVVVQDLRCEHSRLGVAQNGATQGEEPAGIDRGVVVQEDNVLSLRFPYPGVVSSGKTDVGGKDNEFNLPFPFPLQ